MAENILKEFDAAWSEMWQQHSDWRCRKLMGKPEGASLRFAAVDNFQRLCALVANLARERGIDPGPIEAIAISTTDLTVKQREAAAGVIKCLQTDKARVTNPLPRQRQKRVITERQVEAMAKVGQCNGSYKEAAQLMGLNESTVRQHYQSGIKNAGGVMSRKLLGKPKTQPFVATASPDDGALPPKGSRRINRDQLAG